MSERKTTGQILRENFKVRCVASLSLINNIDCNLWVGVKDITIGETSSLYIGEVTYGDRCEGRVFTLLCFSSDSNSLLNYIKGRNKINDEPLIAVTVPNGELEKTLPKIKMLVDNYKAFGIKKSIAYRIIDGKVENLGETETIYSCLMGI